MAEDSGEKTEAPTPRKLEEARERGQIARSQDLNAAVLLLTFLLLMQLFGGSLIDALRTLTAEMLTFQGSSRVSTDDLRPAVLWTAALVGSAIAPLMLGVVIMALVINIMQVGLFASPKRLKPNFGALNPLKGIGRLFKGGEGFVKLLMNLAKLVLVTLVAYSALHGRFDEVISVQQLSVVQAVGLGTSIFFTVAIRLVALLLVLALIDYAWQRFSTQRKLRMSKQEVKDEMRRMEGDPKIKQRRRQIAIQTAMRRMASQVPQADVVVTNPTEIAVALKYDEQGGGAPRVVAKGQGHMAARIRQLAIENGVPIIERKPLARALYAAVEVGQEIPEQFYAAVAEILAYVYELSGRLQRRRAAV